MSQTLERALTILGFVSEEPRHIGEIAKFLDVHHSTALRLLHSMRKYDFVYELPNHQYRLGAAVFRLGFRALEALDLRSIAHPFMVELNDETSETVHLGVLEHGDVVYIDKVEAKHSVRMHSRIGAIAPLHCTGVAKGILAFMPPEQRSELLHGQELARRTPKTIIDLDQLEADLNTARERGFARDDEENEVGIHCVSAPIFNGFGEVEGAISLSTPTSRVDEKTLLGFVPALRRAADRASHELGWSPT
ncbi:IclR family transcriptional regulator [Nocardioides sp.]|uniref:IclR family transcriptional regulator n=1 Tax=Nocardioides sp. TaxID=35761 RepID=UPI0026164217|nr:IclR family transcriptional regulator [Nocardioides sp.]MCW2739049.1 kdgR 2 [Nocardioides sp.]